MPSLFVSGELLGASGLDNVRRELSLASLVDLLGLSPSATPKGFFCTWQLDFGGSHSIRGDAGLLGYSESGWRHDGALSQWRVVRGVVSGQTQTHQHAAPSVDDGEILPSGVSPSCHALDAVWAHPIDLQLAWDPPASGESALLFETWPRLELTVWCVDTFHRSHSYGHASVAVPMTTDELVLDLPIVSERPCSMVDSLARAFGIPLGMKSQPDRSTRDMVLDVIGTAHVRLGLMLHGFQSLGVQCA